MGDLIYFYLGNLYMTVIDLATTLFHFTQIFEKIFI